MYLIPEKSTAIGVMMASLVCIGTFPAIFNYVERRGRKPQHHYIDYCIANFLLALVFALTLGQIGGATVSPNFFTQLSQHNGAAVGFAMAGGVFLCLGNLLMQYSIPFTGVSISELLIASCNVTVGTTINYFLDGRINSAKLLFTGVACFLLAVTFGAITHVYKENDWEAHRRAMGIAPRSSKYLDRSLKGHAEHPTLAMPVGFDMPGMNKGKDDTAHGANSAKDVLDLEKAEAQQAEVTPARGKGGLSQHLLEIQDGEEVQKIRSINTQGKHHVLLGVVLAIGSGCCDGFFSPAFNLSANDQWHKLPQGVPPLSVYCSYFYFTMSFMVVGSALSIYFMYRPPLGIQKTTIKAWFFDNHCRFWSLLAGVICGLGNGFQFMAGQAAGYAAADAVQAFPLVGTFFGIVIFREYANTRWLPTRTLLAIMIVLFSGAVALLASSAQLRKV